MIGQIQIPSIETFYPLIEHLIRALLILIGALIATRIARRLIRTLRIYVVKAMKTHGGGSEAELEKRGETLGGILRKVSAVVIYGIAIVMALREFGFDVAPLLAGAGVAGLAVGFGAQNLVRDIITGFFMLVENQIRVNDIVQINGTGGLVEEMNLRTTVLRGLDGTVHMFPNGAIISLSNLTREFSYYLFNIGVAYKEDTDHVVEAVKEVADQMMKEEEYAPLILAPLEILGVDEFADSAVVIKARFRTFPGKQWVVGREMNRRIKKKFDEVGIEIPFPHTSLYFGEASKPLKVQLDGGGREELKQIIREVLLEARGEQARLSPAKS